MRNGFSDVRLGLRSLRRQPGFTTIAVVTLALGLGANSAMFSVVNGVVLRPLSYDAPEQLIMAWYQWGGGGPVEFPASVPEFIEFRAAASSLQGVAGFVNGSSNISGIDMPLRVPTSFGIRSPRNCGTITPSCKNVRARSEIEDWMRPLCRFKDPRWTGFSRRLKSSTSI